MSNHFDQIPSTVSFHLSHQVSSRPIIGRPLSANGRALSALWNAWDKMVMPGPLSVPRDILEGIPNMVRLIDLQGQYLGRDPGSALIVFSDLTAIAAAPDFSSPGNLLLWPVVLSLPEIISAQGRIYRISPEENAFFVCDKISQSDDTAYALYRQMIREASSWTKLAESAEILNAETAWPTLFPRDEISFETESILVERTQDIADFLAYRIPDIDRVRVSLRSGSFGQGGRTAPHALVSILNGDTSCTPLNCTKISAWASTQIFAPMTGFLPSTFVRQELRTSHVGASEIKPVAITTATAKPHQISAHSYLKIHRKYAATFDVQTGKLNTSRDA
jgi:hypothetical protein